jgi:hypothetical protein
MPNLVAVNVSLDLTDADKKHDALATKYISRYAQSRLNSY